VPDESFRITKIGYRLSEVWSSCRREYAAERLPLLLRLSQLQIPAAPKDRSLLHFLQLWIGALPADASGRMLLRLIVLTSSVNRRPPV